MVLPAGWTALDENLHKYVAVKDCKNGFILRIVQNGSLWADVTFRGKPPLRFALASRNLWSAALELQVIYQKVWENHEQLIARTR